VDWDVAVMSAATLAVSALYTYPIKSCAGVAEETAGLTPRGLEYDRDYMLVGDDGSFLSQRQIPEMAFIAPMIGESAITLNAPGMEPIDVRLDVAPDDALRVEATVHGHPIVGQHLSAEIDEWFTAFLPGYRDNRRYRLLRVREDVPGSSPRVTDRLRPATRSGSPTATRSCWPPSRRLRSSTGRWTIRYR
jgi:hypothetical protein